MCKEKNTLNKKENGQALLFVVVAMTIALAVGINVSLRTLSSISRSSRTDTANRVLAAAEGGAENFIVKPTKELVSLSSVCVGGYSGINSAPAQCVVKYVGTGDNITAAALVTVEEFRYTDNGNKVYQLSVAKDSVREVSLSGYSASSIKLCWTPDAGGDESDLYYIIYHYNSSSNKYSYDKGFLTTGGIPAPYSLGDSTSAGSGAGTSYSHCNTISGLSGNLLSMRIMSLGNNSTAGVFPASGADLPPQGYKITSVGQLFENAAVKEEKTVVVYRSNPYLNSVFDFGIYSVGALN